MCRKVIEQNGESMFHNSFFQETDIQSNWSDGSNGRTTMFLRDPLEVCREQISVLDETEEVICLTLPKPLRLNKTEFKSSYMQISHFYNAYKSLSQRLFWSKDGKVFWNECNPSIPRSFLGYL